MLNIINLNKYSYRKIIKKEIILDIKLFLKKYYKIGN